MNPFDFVPFVEGGPTRKTAEEWSREGGGRLLSGSIQVKLKTLTPLHVGGEVTTRTETVTRSRGGEQNRTETLTCIEFRKFYRQRTTPALPASGLKGAIRAFLEAWTNGVLGAFRPAYRKHSDPTDRENRKGKNRHVGFWIGRDGTWHDRDVGPCEKTTVFSYGLRFEVRNCLPDAFSPGLEVEPMDLASYLFGAPSSPVGLGKREGAQGWRARIEFSDCCFRETDLTDPNRGSPHPLALDVLGNSAFGHPNPRANSWWYFTPDRARVRIVRSPLREFHTTEFLGKRLRGRKFYFHQLPEKALEYYRERWQHLSYLKTDHHRLRWFDDTRVPILVEHPVECVRAGATSDPFEIRFRDLPEPLLKVFLAALCPDQGVRHKMGGLKAFGFGSVEFEITSLQLEPPDLVLDPPPGVARSSPEDVTQGIMKWVEQGLDLDPSHSRDRQDIKDYVNETCWEWLRFVLAFPSDTRNLEERVFAYPPFKGAFDRVVDFREMNGVTLTDAAAVIQAVSPIRATVDFDHYQTTARMNGTDLFGKHCEEVGLKAFQHVPP